MRYFCPTLHYFQDNYHNYDNYNEWYAYNRQDDTKGK